jgi:hypothetical protein
MNPLTELRQEQVGTPFGTGDADDRPNLDPTPDDNEDLPPDAEFFDVVDDNAPIVHQTPPAQQPPPPPGPVRRARVRNASVIDISPVATRTRAAKTPIAKRTRAAASKH